VHGTAGAAVGAWHEGLQAVNAARAHGVRSAGGQYAGAPRDGRCGGYRAPVPAHAGRGAAADTGGAGEDC
jgi:hypothetical protein